MYISAPAGIKFLAKFLIPEDEYDKLEEEDFNIYGDQKSMTILQFMRDLDWIYISYDEGDRISLKPTKTGIEVFENGLSGLYYKKNEKIITLIRTYLENYLKGEKGLAEETQILADHFLKAGNFNRALDLGSDLIELGTRGNDSKLLAVAHQIYGSINLYRMDIEFARNHFDKSIHFAEICDDITTSAKAHLGMGSYFGYKGETDTSLQYFERALLLFKELSDESGINQVRMNEAYLLARMGRIKEFFSLNHQAIDFFESKNDEHHLQSCYQNESAVLLSMGEYDAAIESVTEANHLAKKTGNERIQHLSGINIAMIYIYTKRPGDAYEYIEKAFDYFKRNFDSNGMGFSYQSFMAYDVATKDLESANRNLEKMTQNYTLKKQNVLIAEGLSIYVKVMKLYGYKLNQIQEAISKLEKIAEGIGVREKFLDFIDE